MLSSVAPGLLTSLLFLQCTAIRRPLISSYVILNSDNKNKTIQTDNSKPKSSQQFAVESSRHQYIVLSEGDDDDSSEEEISRGFPTIHKSRQKLTYSTDHDFMALQHKRLQGNWFVALSFLGLKPFEQVDESCEVVRFKVSLDATFQCVDKIGIFIETSAAPGKKIKTILATSYVEAIEYILSEKCTHLQEQYVIRFLDDDHFIFYTAVKPPGSRPLIIKLFISRNIYRVHELREIINEVDEFSTWYAKDWQLVCTYENFSPDQQLFLDNMHFKKDNKKKIDLLKLKLTKKLKHAYLTNRREAKLKPTRHEKLKN